MTSMMLTFTWVTALLNIFLAFAWKSSSWVNLTLKTLLMITGLIGAVVTVNGLGFLS